MQLCQSTCALFCIQETLYRGRVCTLGETFYLWLDLGDFSGLFWMDSINCIFVSCRHNLRSCILVDLTCQIHIMFVLVLHMHYDLVKFLTSSLKEGCKL
jgi:hypothetical protein